jgi:YD repeat-containing protein
MSGSVFSKSCPQCGTVCPYSALSCIRCAFPFPAAAIPNAVPVKRILSVLAALLLAGLVVVVGTLHQVVTSTGAYAQAIALAKSSSEVQSLLGDGIRAQAPAIGFADGSNGSQFTEFSVRLVGSRTGGHLYGVANAVNGVWEFSRLSFLADRTAQKIDLAPTRSRLSLPPVPEKKIYLIPVGLDSSESLDWAPAYYKAKLGIDVAVLPATSLPNDLEDPRRHQVDSERFLERLYRSYPELAQDPSNILIGVTSRDIFIRSFGWSYAENYRHDGRFAVVSSARFHPPIFLDRWNPEWFNSRFQKMLTKNIAILYFDLPMSSDYTSLLSGGALSGREVDLMSGSIIGAEGQWDPFINSGDIEVTIYTVPGKPIVWRLAESREILPQTSSHIFNADLTIGLFNYRKTDFRFDGDYPLQFTRAYRNKDDHSRPFGIGTNDSMDIFLAGQMGSYVDLLFEDGARIHFVHAPAAAGQTGDTYQGKSAAGNLFSHARAVFAANNWTIERRDGWKFYFPYRPHALGPNVTILTGFTDPSGHSYEMIRNEYGDLLSVTTPSGQWLHFDRDSQQRIRLVSDSSGRTVTYDYDAAGRLSHMLDSEGHQERYTYDDKAQMLSITLDSNAPILVNAYDSSGNITAQTMPEGRKFEYYYVRDPGGRGNALVPNVITAPNGLLTHIQYNPDGYTQSLPIPPPQ